jgi:hypothetical protein
MNTRLRKLLPIALCCLPGVAVAAIVGISLAVGGAAFGSVLGGPLGLGLIALAMLACPVSMGLMMMRQRGSGQNSALGNSSTMMECCLPGEALAASEADSGTDRLAALRVQREALERELAEMQSQ